MTPRRFIESAGIEEAKRVSVAAGSSYPYFSQIAYGHRRASPGLAERLAAESAGRMTELEILYPERYQDDEAAA